MPRAPKTATPEDPLADLREPDDRYPPQDDAEGPQEGPAAPGEGDPLASLVFEALGAASACWEDLDKAGAFQDEQAKRIGDDLLEALRPMVDSQAVDVDAAVDRWHKDTVAVGFLHKGGRCGCTYLARVILGA